jgi:hypothetical protein
MTGKDFAQLIATLIAENESFDFEVFGPSEGKPGQAFMRFESADGESFYVEVGKE